MIIQKICVVIFKRTMRGYEFLSLRKSESEGDFWQPVTGTLEKNEDHLTAAKREVSEETGIDENQVVRLLDSKFSYKFKSDNGNEYQECVYGFEVAPACEEIKLSDEHRSFSWCNVDTACALFKYPEHIQALKIIYDKIKS